VKKIALDSACGWSPVAKKIELDSDLDVGYGDP
jgi:hypothetical protein